MVWWNGQEIERSRKLVMFGSNGEPGAKMDYSESGYIEPMSDDELDELIEDLEDARQPIYDKDGNLVVQGAFVRGQDHFIDSYRTMLETLRTHRSEIELPSP